MRYAALILGVVLAASLPTGAYAQTTKAADVGECGIHRVEASPAVLAQGEDVGL